MTTMTATQHNHQMQFGRKVDGCPRCEELKAGAPVHAWGGALKRQREDEFSRAIQAHNCQQSHCGPVCSFGDD